MLTRSRSTIPTDLPTGVALAATIQSADALKIMLVHKPQQIDRKVSAILLESRATNAKERAEALAAKLDPSDDLAQRDEAIRLLHEVHEVAKMALNLNASVVHQLGASPREKRNENIAWLLGVVALLIAIASVGQLFLPIKQPSDVGDILGVPVALVALLTARLTGLVVGVAVARLLGDLARAGLQQAEQTRIWEALSRMSNQGLTEAALIRLIDHATTTPNAFAKVQPLVHPVALATRMSSRIAPQPTPSQEGG